MLGRRMATKNYNNLERFSSSSDICPYMAVRLLSYWGEGRTRAMHNNKIYINLYRKSDHTHPMVQTRWSVLKPKWFYTNQIASKLCISTIVNVKLKEVSVELVFKGGNHVTLDHWKMCLNTINISVGMRREKNQGEMCV